MESLRTHGRGAATPAPVDSGWVRDKRLAGALSLATVAALLLPMVEHWKATPKDSFPLSYYPMFSLKRARKTRVNYLVGIDERGGRHILPYTCAGCGGMNQIRRQINRAVREGRADDLCAAVAASPRLRQDGRFAGLVEVRVVSGEYRLKEYFAGDRTPVSERVVAARPVRRDAA